MSLHLDGNQHASDFPYLFFSPCSLEISVPTAFSLMQGDMHLPKPRGDPHCHCCQSLLRSFPWWAVFPPALWHLRQDPKNFTIMNIILSFMRKGQRGNSSPDNFHGSSFLFNFSSIPSQISKYLSWVHLAGWQKPMIYEADRSLHYRQLFVYIGPSTAL